MRRCKSFLTSTSGKLARVENLSWGARSGAGTPPSYGRDHDRGRGLDPVGRYGDATANTALDRSCRDGGIRDSGRGGSQSPTAGNRALPLRSSDGSRGNKNRNTGSDARHSRWSEREK